MEGLGREVWVHGFDVERCGCELDVMFELEHATRLIIRCLNKLISHRSIEAEERYLSHDFCDVSRTESDMTSRHKLQITVHLSLQKHLPIIPIESRGKIRDL